MTARTHAIWEPDRTSSGDRHVAHGRQWQVSGHHLLFTRRELGEEWPGA